MLRHTMTIARITTIPIRIHWSWLAVLLILVGMLSQVYAAYAGSVTAWIMAGTAALMLCISVILHELGHALVARRYRLSVRSITLFALGGVAEIDGESANPIEELLVAVAGPVVSLALALVSGLIWWRSPWIVLGLLALHLSLTNGVMAVFNLLPGYPMDGGRVLRAVLWFLTDEELPAARIASWIGRACGWTMMLGGVGYVIATGDWMSGTWIGLIGYFLSRSAMIGYRQLVLRRTLSGVSVADLMQRGYRAVTPEMPLDQFVGRFVLGQPDQGFPVLGQLDADAPQPLLGMMTVRNLRRFTISEWAFTHVGEAMTPLHRVRALAPEMPAGDAFRTFQESGEDQLPVIGDSTLLGMLRRRDLVMYIQMRIARRMS